MADAANDGLAYPSTFNEFLALMERWHRAREGGPVVGEHPMEALRRTANELSDVTAMARQVWANAEAVRAAGAQDAARYRWLRDKSEPGICTFYLSVGHAFKGVVFLPETVDVAIDAAMKAEKPPKEKDHG